MTERDEIRPLFKAFQRLGVKKMAALTQGAVYGQGGLVAIREEAPRFGLEIVLEQTHDPAGTDFTAQLSKIEGFGCRLYDHFRC